MGLDDKFAHLFDYMDLGFEEIMQNMGRERREEIRKAHQFKVTKAGDYYTLELKGKEFLFDDTSYRIFEEFRAKKFKYDCFDNNPNDQCYIMNIKKKYLVITDLNFKVQTWIHTFIKRDEARKLAKRLDCPIKDIHVHHEDKNPMNNTLKNLKVLHMDDHAKEYGFDTWEEFQNWRK